MSTYTPREPAERLRLTTRTLGRWRQTGIGPAWIREENSRAIRYTAEDVDSWARAHRHGAPQAA